MPSRARTLVHGPRKTRTPRPRARTLAAQLAPTRKPAPKRARVKAARS